MTDTPNEPLFVSAMRRRAADRRVHVRMFIPDGRGSISTSAAGFLAELDEYVEDVRAEARTLTAEQFDAAARALYENAAAHALFQQVFGHHGWEDAPDGVRAFYRSAAREILTAAGFTVPEPTEGS